MDSILQEYGNAASRSHEENALMRLWASVLATGMQRAALEFTYWSAQQARKDPPPMSAYPDLAWAMSDERFTGSFAWCCDLFNVDPDRARSAWRMKVRELATRAKKQRINKEVPDAE